MTGPALDKTGLEAAYAAFEATGISADHEGIDAAISAYLSTTSAAVTEEQVEALKPFAKYGKLVSRSNDAVELSIYSTLDGKPEGVELTVGDFRRATAALEASRVAPVSQKEAEPVVAAKVKPLDLSALLRDAFLAGRGLNDGDRLSDDDHTAWCAYDPERMNAYNRICAALYASPAPAVEPVGIKEARDDE